MSVEGFRTPVGAQIVICSAAEIYFGYTYIGKKCLVIGSFFLVNRWMNYIEI
jgi:hypothetical protein